ncbi:Lipin/Ned1/Smp2-domain-containing protein [Gymnopilus junonius]|uniref:phosphatidate phosphatase n=1 Tax=Gymnopilus junonius TaxID=109634 RepID=A0A9P5P030_GYMJU|nr:Lipin/Ned1/Smp2-domain-containing protein [Gymnopilus junonius]
MNYIRGAVNAISAPYQYYKELPPINPATLTGAIDVIVVQRPGPDGDTELACSPFHVRFGKWQVLRPGEKKVNVFVNGNPIPFNMKIGEAGEAFFVFETTEEVPDDLITSPILQPTIPSEVAEEKPKEEPVESERFGAKQEGPSEQVAPSPRPKPVEPDFLDLDGGSQQAPADEFRTTPKQTFNVPHFLRKSGSKATLNQKSALSHPEEDSAARPHTPQMLEQDMHVDAALRALKERGHVPEVEYHDDVVLDMEGYKANYHDRETSGQTVRSSSSKASTSQSNYNDNEHYEFPRKSSPSLPQLPSSPLAHTDTPSPSPSPLSSRSSSPTSAAHTFLLRATSEPPPDIDSDNDTIPTLSPSNSHLQLQKPQQEYSWEWGAFPQPSPMKTSFGKEGHRKNTTGFAERRGRLINLSLSPTVDEDEAGESVDYRGGSASGLAGRSRSVPPQSSEGHRRKGSREYKEYEDIDDHDKHEGEAGDRPWIEGQPTEDKLELGGSEKEVPFGAGGTLTASYNDPTIFVLKIEGRTIGFQLSLVPEEENIPDSGKRQSNEGSSTFYHKRPNEFDAAELFNKHRIDWKRFLEDDSIVNDPRLVIFWGGDQYITRKDGSPLMDALVHWRSSALKKRASGDALRPVSPPPPSQVKQQDGEEVETSHDFAESKSQPPSTADPRPAKEDEKKLAEATTTQQRQIPAKKPTSSSWVQWWSRSRSSEIPSSANNANGHVLDSTKDSSSSSLPLPPKDKSHLNEQPKNVSDSTPPTPLKRQIDHNDSETTPTRPPASNVSIPAKKFAKTLRLTSDQLKSLNLRPGANAITFSLSASGAIAATARIFVWEYTDLVVVSDIDGTITKSDGLGHVFAMIGRDWTHVGVAKLYTDIARNGYKIMYLTSRAIGQADATRDYLKGIKQNNYQLPEGPVIMSPDRLLTSLHREVIMRKPEVFKMACLRDIQRLFGESARNPFYAGFGNRITDALSYRSVNVPSARIFTIDSSGEVKMELLELAGYKSSYIHMTDLVDQMFPPIHRKWAPEFTDFNYWKTPVQDFPLPDLSPPSPALSARSDTSNQSALARLRNFSLGGNAINNNPRHQVSKQPSVSSVDLQSASDGEAYRDSHLRQMSSFEKLSSTLGFMTRFNSGDIYRRSVSPSSSSSYLSDDEDAEDEVGAGGQRKRVRRRSMTSMPGSLDDMQFGLDDSDDEDHHGPLTEKDFIHDNRESGEEDTYYGEGEDAANPEEQADEAFDDDILAAGEMQNVPFL